MVGWGLTWAGVGAAAAHPQGALGPRTPRPVGLGFPAPPLTGVGWMG